MVELIKELFEMEQELHEEYQDNDTSYVIDILREGNKLTCVITFNSDKKEFESWVDNLPDDIYEEAIELLKEDFDDFTEVYTSDNYKEVIDAFKEKVKEVASNKVRELQALVEPEID